MSRRKGPQTHRSSWDDEDYVINFTQEKLRDTLSDDVLKYIKSLSELISSMANTYDVYNNMKKVWSLGLVLLKFGNPISALVAAGASTVLEPSKEELEALKLLNEKFSEHIEESRNVFFHIQLEMQEIYSQKVEMDYYNKFTSPLNGYELYINRTTNDNRDIRKYYSRFLWDHCTNTQISPIALYKDYVTLFSTNCQPYGNYNDSKLYFKESLMLQQVVAHVDKDISLNRAESFDWENLKFLVLASFQNMEEHDRQQILKLLHKAADSAFLPKLDAVVKPHYPNKTCWFYYWEHQSKHNRVQMRAQHNLVLLDMLRLGLFTSACSNFTSNGTESLIRKTLETAADAMKRVSYTSYDRLQIIERFEAYPVLSTSYAKDVLTTTDIAYSEESYNSTAAIVRPEFNSRGQDNLDYYTLVSLHDTSIQTWCNITQYTASIIFQTKTVDVHVVPHNVQKYNMAGAQRYKVWFEKQRQPMYDDIANWADLEACAVLSKLDAKYNLTQSFSKSFLFRKVKWSSADSEIYVGRDFSELSTELVFTLDYYYNNPLAIWTNMHHYRLFLLV
ncbi:hypothetical protein L596_006128 [Steinernema carpocapsae]|uniref:DUF6546 domain-containing protein n=1 Tax=Steinernema carpocapsae TaxID=34508 RepID=A0A4U8V163_STECR|nr:hypothetical protein L596_006128 [Steinernema carpocapsae]